MQLMEALQSHIRRRGLFGPSDRLLLGLSGGLDSMVLASLLQRLGYRLGLAHGNFCLRGEESEGDERFVRRWAAQQGLPLFVARFPTQQEAQQAGESTQQAARRLRYQWWHRLCQQEGFAYILTAHHADDLFETQLYQLAKGPTLRGLRGIPEKQGILCRPLLPFARQEIEAHARQHQIPYREDTSNQKTDYRRNFLRHRVVPEFRAINPRPGKTAYEHLPLWEGALALLEREKEAVFGQCLHKRAEGQFLQKGAWAAQPWGFALFREWLAPQGWSFGLLQQAWEGSSQPGQVFENRQEQLITERDGWWLMKKAALAAESPMQELPLKGLDERDYPLQTSIAGRHFSLALQNPDELPPAELKNPASAVLDYHKLQPPLLIRPWQTGDRFRPFGMGGHSKLLSDFLTDQKVPAATKAQALVLEAAGQVVWVVGHRIAEGYGLDSGTRKVLIIRERP